MQKCYVAFSNFFLCQRTAYQQLNCLKLLSLSPNRFTQEKTYFQTRHKNTYVKNILKKAHCTLCVRNK